MMDTAASFTSASKVTVTRALDWANWAVTDTGADGLPFSGAGEVTVVEWVHALARQARARRLERIMSLLMGW
ncbi:MAG: hypothetical protein AMXMBFR34_12580 [Myxococcaceae bacterium]